MATPSTGMRRRARTYTDISPFSGSTAGGTSRWEREPVGMGEPPAYESGEETAVPDSPRRRALSRPTSRSQLNTARTSPTRMRGSRPPSPSRPARSRPPTPTSPLPTRSWPSFPPPLAGLTPRPCRSSSDEDEDDEEALYMTSNLLSPPRAAPRPPPTTIRPLLTTPLPNLSRPNLTHQISSPSDSELELLHRPISTNAPMTETDDDFRPARLPTTRRMRRAPFSYTFSLDKALQNPLTAIWGDAPTTLDILFGALRFLSIIPATIGAMFLVVDRDSWHYLDTITALIFNILTAYQCLMLTSGLLFRWRTYYPPLPTLVRLLALQIICWTATQVTITSFPVGNTPQPVPVWAFMATCTSISRAVQMWVTSNLWRHDDPPPPPPPKPTQIQNQYQYAKYAKRERARWRGGTWKGRRWDWGAVTRRCVVPLGMAYFVMAWAGVVIRWEREV